MRKNRITNLREKLLQQGPEALANTELLALVLGCHYKNGTMLARALMSDYHSLQALFQADYHTLLQHKGIGIAKYTAIKAIGELNRRALEEPLYEAALMTDSEAVKKYLIAALRMHTEEIFGCLFLNTQFRLIRFEKLFRGTVNSATVHPREVLKRAITLNATAIIVAHNHPSGNLEPSEADKNITRHLSTSLGLIEVQLIDHILIAGHRTFSFAEHGYL